MTESLTEQVWHGGVLAATADVPGTTSEAIAHATLGSLVHSVAWWARVNQHGMTPPSHVHGVVLAGDHPGIASAGATSRTPAHTLDLVRTLLDGSSALHRLAEQSGAQLQVIDVSMAVDVHDVPERIGTTRVCQGAGRIDVEDAAIHDATAAAFALGRAQVDALADRGTDLILLGCIGGGTSAPATALITLLTGTDLVDNVSRADVSDDVMWMHKTAMIREAILRTRPLTHDPLGMVAACGGADLAAAVGMLIHAAVRGVPVLMEGVTAAAAALIAERMLPGAHVWWAVADVGNEPAAHHVYEKFGLTPWLTTGQGSPGLAGALLALPMLSGGLELLRADA